MRYTKNLFVGFSALAGVIFVGTFLFSRIEKKSLFESLYYIVLNVTTVGAPKELLPITFSGKILAMFVILFGMGIALYLVMLIARILIEGQVLLILNVIHGGFRRMKKLKNHVIVCGYGKLGRYVCKSLKEEKQNFLVVEHDEEKVDKLLQTREFVVRGDALNPDTLKSAGINRAKALIAVLANDADNIYLIMSAKELKPGLIFAAKASDEKAVSRLHKIGAQIVVLPEVVGGRRLVKAVMELKSS